MDCPQCGTGMLTGTLTSTGAMLWRDTPPRRGLRSLLTGRSLPVGRPGGMQAVRQAGWRCPKCRLLIIPLSEKEENRSGCV